MDKTFDSPAPFSEFVKVQVPFCVWLCTRWQKQSSGPNGVLCSVCRDAAEKFNKENYWLWLSSSFFLFFFSLSSGPWWGRCALPQTWEWVKSGPWGPVRDDISWLHGSKTNTQTCPGVIRPSSPIFLLHGSNSIMSQHVCVCLSILQAKPDLTLLGSPAGLADVARDPCDPATSTVMIRVSVCAAARWGVAALAASFPPVSNAQAGAPRLGHGGSLTQAKPDELENF